MNSGSTTRRCSRTAIATALADQEIRPTMHPPARPHLLLFWLLAALGGSAAAQHAPAPGGIYTCTDAKGHRLTSDRPIPECIDREQKELNASGTVRRTLGPSLTATERAAQEERERKLAEERQREAEEKRVEKALLSRYPNQATHDAERAKALQAQRDVVAAGQRHLADLRAQRRKLDQETEFYKSPKQWPAKLRRQIEENEQQVAGQQRFIADQEEERTRINARFDEELARLKVLWARTPQTAAAGAGSGPKKP